MFRLHVWYIFLYISLILTAHLIQISLMHYIKILEYILRVEWLTPEIMYWLLPHVFIQRPPPPHGGLQRGIQPATPYSTLSKHRFIIYPHYLMSCVYSTHMIKYTHAITHTIWRILTHLYENKSFIADNVFFTYNSYFLCCYSTLQHRILYLDPGLALNDKSFDYQTMALQVMVHYDYYYDNDYGSE